MTGENSFIRLSHDGGKTLATRASHWRVLWCPAGSGHTLFVQSRPDRQQAARLQRQSGRRALAADVDRVAALPDLRRHEPAGDRRPRSAAQGDAHSSAVETVDSATDHIRLTWWDTVEPFVLTMAPGTNNRPIGVFSTFFPARSAQLELNGRFATGKVWAEMRGDRQASSATLAWSETWVKPRG